MSKHYLIPNPQNVQNIFKNISRKQCCNKKKKVKKKYANPYRCKIRKLEGLKKKTSGTEYKN